MYFCFVLIERNISDAWMLLLMFLVAVVVFAVLKAVAPNKTAALYSSYFSAKAFKQHEHDEFFVKNYPALLLVLLSSLTITFVLAVLEGFDTGFIFTSAAYIFFFLVAKVLIIYALVKIISSSSSYRFLYLFEILTLIVAGTVGLLFLPLDIITPVQNMEALLYSVFVALILLKIFKQIAISLSKGIPLFYIILYLCALEIIPALLLFRAWELI